MNFQSDQPNKPNRPNRPDEPAFVGRAQLRIGSAALTIFRGALASAMWGRGSSGFIQAALSVSRLCHFTGATVVESLHDELAAFFCDQQRKGAQSEWSEDPCGQGAGSEDCVAPGGIDDERQDDEFCRDSPEDQWIAEPAELRERHAV